MTSFRDLSHVPKLYSWQKQETYAARPGHSYPILVFVIDIVVQHYVGANQLITLRLFPGGEVETVLRHNLHFQQGYAESLTTAQITLLHLKAYALLYADLIA